MTWTNGLDAGIPVPLTTEIDSETGEVIITSWRTEYHINLPTWPKTPDEFFVSHPELISYRVIPTSLSRIFAGDDPSNPTMTAALRFTDELEAKQALTYYWIEDEE